MQLDTKQRMSVLPLITLSSALGPAISLGGIAGSVQAFAYVFCRWLLENQRLCSIIFLSHRGCLMHRRVEYPRR